VLKAFGDWHAPIEAFMALAKCLRDIAQLVCCAAVAWLHAVGQENA